MNVECRVCLNFLVIGPGTEDLDPLVEEVMETWFNRVVSIEPRPGDLPGIIVRFDEVRLDSSPEIVQVPVQEPAPGTEQKTEEPKKRTRSRKKADVPPEAPVEEAKPVDEQKAEEQKIEETKPAEPEPVNAPEQAPAIWSMPTNVPTQPHVPTAPVSDVERIFGVVSELAKWSPDGVTAKIDDILSNVGSREPVLSYQQTQAALNALQVSGKLLEIQNGVWRLI